MEMILADQEGREYSYVRFDTDRRKHDGAIVGVFVAKLCGRPPDLIFVGVWVSTLRRGVALEV